MNLTELEVHLDQRHQERMDALADMEQRMAARRPFVAFTPFSFALFTSGAVGIGLGVGMLIGRMLQ